jgi:hypothetical protein
MMRERTRLEREIVDLLPREYESSVDPKVTNLTLLSHFVERSGAPVALDPSQMDPGFYDGTDKYKIADQRFQDCLVAAMAKGYPRAAAVLVDLTTSPPTFAGYRHKQQGDIASTGKLAAILAIHQLQFDLRTFSAAHPSLTTAADVFKEIRKQWIAAQVEPAGAATTFTTKIQLKGKVVLMDGKRVAMKKDRLPNLEAMFKTTDLSFDFASTGEGRTALRALKKKIHDMGDTKDAGDRALAVLKDVGFFERLRLMAGGNTNAPATTCIRDVGYMYIASTVIQTGLYDPARGGGLWLGYDYGGKVRRTWFAPAGSQHANAHAAALATYFTLLRQGRLVSAAASQAMLDLLDKDQSTHPTTHSPFEDTLEATYGAGVQAWEKLGIGTDGFWHDTTSFQYDLGGKTFRYVAVGLFSTKARVGKMILPLEKCTLARQGVTR